VAECAKRVIKDNGFDGHINLIPKRSTDLTVGPSMTLVHLVSLLKHELTVESALVVA